MPTWNDAEDRIEGVPGRPKNPEILPIGDRTLSDTKEDLEVTNSFISEANATIERLGFELYQWQMRLRLLQGKARGIEEALKRELSDAKAIEPSHY